MNNVLYYLCGAYVLGAIVIKGFSAYLLWERLKIRKNEKMLENN